MNAYRFSAIAVLSLAVASCGGSSTAPDASEGGSSSVSTTSMPGAPIGAQATKTGKGTGTVTAIDAAGGKITLDHGPIPELGWPAMKMAFKATSAVTGSTAVGDKVEFDVRLTGMESEVTAIVK